MEVGTARPASCDPSSRAAGAPVRHYLAAARVDPLWSMVLGNRLTYAHFYFRRPQYNSALIVSASLSSELEQ
jgi:hypothetical protein